MSSHYITVSQLKVNCLALVEEVAQTHKMFIVTKHGKPIAKVCPIEHTKPPFLGGWAGTVDVDGDIVHFDTSEDWEAFNE